MLNGFKSWGSSGKVFQSQYTDNVERVHACLIQIGNRASECNTLLNVGTIQVNSEEPGVRVFRDADRES